MDIIEVTPKTPRQDFLDVMKFINDGIEKKLFPFMPRRTLITEEEIDYYWIPSLNDNITYHAKEKKVIGSATIFQKTLTTGYEDSAHRSVGALGLVVNPSYGQEVVQKLIATLVDNDHCFYDIIPVEDEETILTYREAGLWETKIYDQRFVEIGLSGNCKRFTS